MKAVNPDDMRPGGLDGNDPNQQPQQPPLDAGAGTADAGGGVLDGVGAVADGAGAVLDGASVADALGCLDGCASCSVALFIGLFLTAGAAFAMFR